MKPFGFICLNKTILLLALLIISTSWSAYARSSLDAETIKALKKNNWDYLKKQIQNGFDVNSHDHYGLTLLHKSIGRRNSKEFTSYLIKNGANINAKDTQGYTPVLTALLKKDIYAFDMLIKEGASVIGDVKGNSALHYAAKDKVNGIRTIPLLLELGVNSKHINEMNQTPLHVLMSSYIPSNDYLRLLKMIIENDVDLNQQNSSGETILLMALKRASYKEVVDLLLNNNVDVTLSSKTDSVVTAAFHGGYINTPVLSRLVKMGAKIDDSGLNGVTLLHLLSSKRDKSKSTDSMITDLIKKGFNPNIIDDKGNTPLINAAELGDFNRVKLLVSLGSEINYRKPSGPTVLQSANWTDNKKIIIKYLLEKGANINAVEGHNDSLLYSSMNHGKPDDLMWIKYLLDKGAIPNIFVPRQSPGSPYEWADVAKNNELKKLLVSYGAYTKKEANIKFEIFFNAIKNGQLETVKNILNEGFYVDNHCPERFNSGATSFCKGSTALVVAIHYKKDNIIDYLLSKGANAERDEPLLRAAASGNIELVNKLFKHGSKTNLNTLLASITNNHIELTKKLLKHGSPLEDKYRSSLKESIMNSNVQMLKLLISNGGDVHWRGADGLSLLQMAYNGDNREAIQVLKKNNAAISSDIYINGRTKKPHHNSKIAVDAIKYNDINKLQDLISQGYEFNLKTPNINLALSRAAKLGNIETLRLIESHSTFTFGINRLIESVMKGAVSQSIENYELEDFNKVDMWGRSALYYSIIFKNKDAFSTLVEAGASISSTKSGANPLFVAIKWSLDATDIILKQGKHSERQLNEALYTAVVDNNTAVVKLLLDAGAKPSAPKRTRRTSPIYIATENNNHDLIKLLLKYDVDPTQGFSPRLSYLSSIGFAIIKNMDEVALDLILYSNRSLPDPKYGNAIELALIGGKYKLLELMLKEDKTNIDELFFKAATGYWLEAINILEKHGAEPTIKNKSNQTVIQKLKERKNYLSKYESSESSEEIEKIDSMIKLIIELF